MRQVTDANWQVPYTGGWCLNYVERAFGTAIKYPTAINAWYNEKTKCFEVPPLGITVPVYFKLDNEPAGHIAIRLSDGTVASSTLSGTHPQGFIHKSMDDMIATYARYNGGCNYLGYTKELAGTIIVIDSNEEEDMINKDNLEIIYSLCLGRAPDPDGIKHYVGNYSASYTLRDVYLSKEAESYRNNKIQHEQALISKINSLTDKNKQLNSQLVELNNKLDTVIVNYTKQIDELNLKILELENNKISLDDYTLGQLLSESVKKIFKIK